MTTHILEVAERMADRIGVIAHGRLIAEGTLDDLRRHVDRQAANNGASAGVTATDGNASLEDTFLALVAEFGGSRVMAVPIFLPRSRGRRRAKRAGGGK